jgi:hypothetical protein
MKGALPIFTLAIASITAAATAAGPDAAGKAGNGSDRLICRKIHEIGSRLARHRICLTAEQWAQQRREQRAEIERDQQRQTQPGGH